MKPVKTSARIEAERRMDLIAKHEQVILDAMDAPQSNSHTYIGTMHPSQSGTECHVYNARNRLIGDFYISNDELYAIVDEQCH